jgi:hypothetical protein
MAQGDEAVEDLTHVSTFRRNSPSKDGRLTGINHAAPGWLEIFRGDPGAMSWDLDP